MNVHLSSQRVLRLGLLSLMTAALGPTFASGQTHPPFTIASEREIARGITMICPSHRHGTLDQAIKKLTNLTANLPADRPSSSWVCRSNQLPTLEKITPLVDEIYINPYVLLSTDPPAADTPVWPGCDHPMLNQVRAIRDVAGADQRLIACIDLRGEPSHYEKRRASFEEIEWLTLAVVGAGYQGIVWRSEPDPKAAWRMRLRRLEDGLRAYAQELADARPVAWVSAGDGGFVSATAGEHRLFVCVLHDQYMHMLPDHSAFQLPLEVEPSQVQLRIALPLGTTVQSGQTLGGVPVVIENADGHLAVNHRVRGGGDMLIFDLTTASARASDTLQQDIAASAPQR